MKIAIIGAGLAGSILANRLCREHDVTVIEPGARRGPLAVAHHDAGVPAVCSPHAASGPGGTSAYWHNGLIEPEASDFAAWPISKAALESYYRQSWPLLSGIEQDQVETAATMARAEYAARGIAPDLPGLPLFYPRKRRNLWKSLGNARHPIRLVQAQARHLIVAGNRVTGVALETGVIEADIVICCAGGLGNVPILARTANRHGLAAAINIGRHYHDHPTGMVAELKLSRRFHDIWNYTAPGLDGALRTPLVIRGADGRKAAFYLRPAALTRGKKDLASSLSELRNAPFNPRNIARFLGSSADIMEFASFMAGINIPTDTYSILLAAEQPMDGASSVESTDGVIVRNWQFTPQFRACLEGSLQAFLARMAPLTVRSEIFAGWQDRLASGAHHSGTCRMASVARDGVCDADNAIFGLDNAFVCDGSAIPSSGFANTGLTIAALALRLADHIKRIA